MVKDGKSFPIIRDNNLWELHHTPPTNAQDELKHNYHMAIIKLVQEKMITASTARDPSPGPAQVPVSEVVPEEDQAGKKEKPPHERT